MNTSLLKLILTTALGFTGWNLAIDWLDSSNGKPFDPLRAAHMRRELLQINWGNPGLCTRFSPDYDKKADSCGNRGKRYEPFSQTQTPK